MQRWCVVLPTYDEADTLPKSVSRILALPGEFGIIVVDDNSPDGTGEVAESLAQSNSNICVLHRPERLGLGTAYLAGLDYALKGGAEVAVTMDADLSHDAAVLPAMVRATQQWDVVVGSRFAPGGGLEGLSWIRRAFSVLANVYIRLLLGLSISDCTSGYRAYNRTAMRLLGQSRLRGQGYAALPELLWRAKNGRLTVGEVPIKFLVRAGGRSKVTLRGIVESLLNPWRLRLSGY